MSLGKAVFSRATTYPALASLIGDRLYPEAVPEHVTPVFPLAAYEAEDDDDGNTYGGGDALVSGKVTITGLARTGAERQQLRDAILEAFDDQSGEWGGVTVQGAFVEDENKFTDRDPTTGEGSQLFGIKLQFLVWYET